MLGVIKEKNYLHPFILWLMLLLWYLIFADNFFSTPQNKLDHSIAEQSFWLFNRTPEEANEITIIAIDEASRRRLNLKWPWNRNVTASLIRQIAAHAPKVIGLDIVFAGKSQPDEDRELISALKSHPHVILGYVLYKDSQEKPVQDFIDAAHSIGFVNKPLQEGRVTETRLFNINDGNEVAFSLEAEILISYLGLDRSNIRVDQNGIFLRDGLFIPSSQGVTSINYLVHPSSLKIISAASVLDKKVNPLDFRNKIVLVGATDPLIHDEYPTALGVLPGVTIIANSLLTLLSRRFVYSASWAQNVFLCFALGFVVLFINRRLNFLPNTFYTIVLLVITYLSLVYLRARDFHFAYLSILFSGTTAYLVPTIYKHLNLLYLSKRLKNLSIIDPLTGFYSLRFFLLQLDELIKARPDFNFVALRLGNYKQLTLQLNFEQIKLLTGIFGEHLRSEVKKKFRNPIFCRISNDTLGIILQKAAKEELETFFRAFFQKTKKLDWDLGQQKKRITLQGCLIHRPRSKTGKSDDFLQQMEKRLQEIEADEFLVGKFEHVADESRKTRRGDILDFIAYDWHERNKNLELSLKENLRANQRLDLLSRGALTALARAIDAKSEWTAGHSENVTQLAVKLGRALGLGAHELENLYRGGLLHDIGKIGTPAHLLDKNGSLTDQEYHIIREHPGIGERILEPIDPFAEILPIVKQHHERFDGTGYPDGLAGEEIDFGARIMAVADVWDALCSDRPYRAGIDPKQVLQIIRKDAGRQFDPRVVEALVKVIEQDQPLQQDAVEHSPPLPERLPRNCGLEAYKKAQPGT